MRHRPPTQYYIWADDPFTRELKAILAERVRNGVEVRLLYDPIGSLFRLTRRYKRELTESGVHWAPFSASYDRIWWTRAGAAYPR